MIPAMFTDRGLAETANHFSDRFPNGLFIGHVDTDRKSASTASFDRFDHGLAGRLVEIQDSDPVTVRPRRRATLAPILAQRPSRWRFGRCLWAWSLKVPSALGRMSRAPVLSITVTRVRGGHAPRISRPASSR